MAFMRRPIPHMQMLKHIGQRPALKLCRRSKSGVIQILHQLIQAIGLGFKIQGFAQHVALLFFARLNGDHQIISGDLCVSRHQHFGNRAVDRCQNLVLHFHRLDNRQTVT